MGIGFKRHPKSIVWTIQYGIKAVKLHDTICILKYSLIILDRILYPRLFPRRFEISKLKNGYRCFKLCCREFFSGHFQTKDLFRLWH